MKILLFFFMVLAVCAADGQQVAVNPVDAFIGKLMDTAQVTGLCLGIVQDNRVAYVKAYGYKNKAAGTMNDTATCFYGASLSKAVFAYLVMQLVDTGLIDLDKPLYTYLPQPIPAYAAYKDLANDDRWKLITARHCLDHTTGFPNWRMFNPRDSGRLEFFFTPGERNAYSGEGLKLLQLIIETITGRPLDELAQEKIFRPFGMRRTSYLWQPAFESDYAVGHLENEDTIPKNKRTRANAAGSMETTIADYTRFVAAVLRGEGLSARSRQEMLSPQISIYSLHQFPSLDTATTTANQRIGLCYGLGWGLFTSPRGKAFFKEGHDDGWEHYALCLPGRKEAFVVMTNSSNGERIFKELFEKLSEVTIPWEWEQYTPYRGYVILSPSLLREFTGNYVGKFNASFRLAGDRMTVESPDAPLPATPVYAENDHHFFLKTMDVQIDFVRGGDGKVIKAAIIDEGDRYDLMKVYDTLLNAEQLRLYKGIYQAGADHRIIVSFRKGRLYVEATNPGDRLPTVQLYAFHANEFYIRGAPLKFRFVRDDQGRAIKLITYGSLAKPAEWVREE